MFEKPLCAQIEGEQTGGRVRQGIMGKCRKRATAMPEGRSVRLERRGCRQGWTPDTRFQDRVSWVVGGRNVRDKQSHLGNRMMLSVVFTKRVNFY